MKVFELLPRPLGNIFRKLTHLPCNSPQKTKKTLYECIHRRHTPKLSLKHSQLSTTMPKSRTLNILFSAR